MERKRTVEMLRDDTFYCINGDCDNLISGLDRMFNNSYCDDCARQMEKGGRYISEGVCKDCKRPITEGVDRCYPCRIKAVRQTLLEVLYLLESEHSISDMSVKNAIRALTELH